MMGQLFIRKLGSVELPLQPCPVAWTSSQLQQRPCGAVSLEDMDCEADIHRQRALEPISLPLNMPCPPSKLPRTEFSESSSAKARLEPRFVSPSAPTPVLGTPVKVVCNLTPTSFGPRSFDGAPAEGAISSSESLAPGQTGSPLATRLQEPSLVVVRKEVVDSASVCEEEVDWSDDPCILWPSNPEQLFALHVFVAISRSMETQNFVFKPSAHFGNGLDHLFITCCL